MKPDDLEQRLVRTPRTGAPPTWRAEILTAARAARSATLADQSVANPGFQGRQGRLGSRGRTAWWGVLDGWLRPRLAWASPWGVLAAGWMLVLGVHLAGSWIELHPPTAVAVVGQPPISHPRSTTEVWCAARTYRAEVVALAELDEATIESASVTERPAAPQPLARPPAGRPRTERDADRRGAALDGAWWMA